MVEGSNQFCTKNNILQGNTQVSQHTVAAAAVVAAASWLALPAAPQPGPTWRAASWAGRGAAADTAAAASVCCYFVLLFVIYYVAFLRKPIEACQKQNLSSVLISRVGSL